MQRVLWKNGEIYTPEGIYHDGNILVGIDGKIEAVGTVGDINTEEVIHKDLRGHLVLPGLIDVHVHGGGGFSMMNGTYADLEGMSRFHAEHGTTSFLATTSTNSVEHIEKALTNAKRGMERGVSGAELAGVHLEGPFLDELRAGAQKKDHLLQPDLKQLEQFLSAAAGSIRLVTLAPELVGGMELVDHLVSCGVTVSIGHSDALYTDVEEAVKRGVTHTTHHFNGMRPMHHRDPGVAGGGLILDELTTELIADGIHVHPAIIRMLYKTKSAERICAITDAVFCAGLPDGEYGNVAMNNGQIELIGGNTLAGSSLTMLKALRNVIEFTGLSLEDVLPSFTSVPARQVKLDGRKGMLKQGMDADFIVIDTEYSLRASFVRGCEVVNNDL